jgi:putative transposase
VKERLQLIDKDCNISVRRQSELLGISRSTLYFKPRGESEENLELMRKMDELFIDDPTLGVLGMIYALMVSLRSSTSFLQ